MNNENREIMPGETMFNYLKRKKRLILEKAVNQNKNYTHRQPLQERTINQSMDNDKTKREELHDRTRHDDSREYSISRSTLKDTHQATTRRTSIIEDTRRPMHRSFIQMISPIRSKSPAREVEKSTGRDASLPKKDWQNFTRNKLNEKINLMRDTIESQFKAARSLKQKSHLLFLDLKPFFRHLQNCGEAGFERKTEEIKGKVRAIESIFNQFNTETKNGNIDQFFMHFSQYLNELEGQSKAEIQQNKDALTSEISTAKNKEIYELRDANGKLQKEIAIINKKYTKLQRNYEELLDQTQHKLSEKDKRYEQRVHCLQSELIQSQQKNKDLLHQLQVITQSNKKYQQQRKQLISQRQRFQEECLNTITRVKSQQEEFLLNEIMVLKKEFNVDISKMAELYKIKEDDLLRKTKELHIEIQTHKNTIQDILSSNKKLDESLVAVQSQNIRIKKQNQCLATDMHRINEQLYQHWLALKDIKTLSQRLDIFNKFKKIYEELLFNQQLFL